MTIFALVARIILLSFERIIVKKLGRNSGSIEATLLFFGIGALCLLPFVIGVEVQSWAFLRYALPAGALYSIAFVYYVKALSEGDVSLVTPVASFNVLFLFLLSVIFLGDTFTVLKLVGIVLIFYGSSYLKPGANLLQSLRSVLAERACLYMLVFTLLLTVGRIIDTAGSKNVSSLLYAFVIYALITLILLGYLLLQQRGGELIRLFRAKPGIALISGGINASTYLLLIITIKGIEVSVAEPLALLSTLLAVILGKYIFHEQIQQRLIASIIIVVGVWLLLL